MIFQDRREDRFAAAVAVRVGGVDVVDAAIDRAANDALRFFVGVIAPPPGRHRPGAESELREFEICAVKAAEAHDAKR